MCMKLYNLGNCTAFCIPCKLDQLAIDDSEVNPYHKGLCAMVDTELFQNPD